jgi:indolepyruvate decarboxylase
MTSSVADYVILRLKQHGVDTIFGIPGTSCAAVFASAGAQGLATVINSSELDAGYAADGYARMRGLGAVSVSYGVGTLSLINAVAGSFVERSAMVVLNGGPSAKELWNERRYGVLFSHSTGLRGTDLAVFANVTAFAARAEHPREVPSLVDKAIAIALREQRPVYLEIANDIWKAPCKPPVGSLDATRVASGAEGDIAQEMLRLIKMSKRPALVLGVELARYGLADKARHLIKQSGLPWATTLLAKSVLPEDTPGFVGVYDSDLAPKPVRELLEGSDCLLALGCVFGVDHGNLVTSRFSAMTAIGDGWARIGDGVPRRAELAPMLDRLAECFPEPEAQFALVAEERTFKRSTQ